jgi:hypothetical protein
VTSSRTNGEDEGGGTGLSLADRMIASAVITSETPLYSGSARPVGKKEFRLPRVDNEAAQEQTHEAIDRLAEALS